MFQERDEGHDPKARQRIVSPDFDKLVQKSRHWDRVFPEAAEWRREQMQRARLEATNEVELLEMTSQISLQEWVVFPEAERKILGDHEEDVLDRYESQCGLYYLYLFGLMRPLKRNMKGGKKVVDWEKAFDLTS